MTQTLGSGKCDARVFPLTTRGQKKKGGGEQRLRVLRNRAWNRDDLRDRLLAVSVRRYLAITVFGGSAPLS